MLTRINGLDTYYTLEGQGPPVVLLHGWGASSQSLHLVASALLAGSFRVLALDLPGFGWTPAPPAAWGSADYAGHVLALLRGTGIERAAVLGHSFGGRIALHLASREPAWIARLVLVASAGLRPRRGPGYYARAWATRLVKGVFSLPGWGALGERAIARWRDRVGSRDYRAAGAMRPTLVKLVNEDANPLPVAIRAPTLLLWGDQDREVRREAVERMAAGIAGSRLVVLPGAGHFPFLDAPEAFCRRLTDFLLEGERW